MEERTLAGVDGPGSFVTTASVEMAESSVHEDLRERAEIHGYLLLRRLIEPVAIFDLRGRVLQVCEALGWLDAKAPVGDGVARPGVRIGLADAAWTELQRRVAGLREFDRIREHDEIHGVLRRIFRSPVRSGCGDVCRVVSAAPEVTTRPHQDGFYLPGDRIWTVWVPLGDCPRSLGGLAVLPGSHRGGLRPHAPPDASRQGIEGLDDTGWASTDYRAGDVLFFDRLTVHRALQNRSADRLRVSADFRYAPAPARSWPSDSLA